MAPARPLACILLLAFVLAPAASATQVLSWTGPAASVSPPLQQGLPALPDGALALLPLGDVDGDGAEDVLRQVIDRASGATEVAAVSGADLETVLWSVPLADAQRLVPGPDVDADGVLDPVLAELRAEGEATGEGVSGATAERMSASGDVVFQALSGASGNARFDVSAGVEVESGRGGLDLLGLAGLQAGARTEASASFAPVGAGAYWRLQVDATEGGTGIQAGGDGAGAGSAELDATLDLLDAQGQARATVELTGPREDPVAILASDLGLDGAPEAVVLALEEVAPASTDRLPVHIPHVRAFDGVTGDLSWEAELEALAGQAVVLPSLGDVNADGHVDVGVVTISAGVAGGNGFQVLSGLDGKALAAVSEAASVVAAVPFGDVDADGAAEVLRIEETGGMLRLSLAGADLEARWSIEVPPSAMPLNIEGNAHTGLMTGFTDLTGDAVPDVALAVPQEGATLLRLVSGLDGSVVWEAAHEHVVGLARLPDVSGAGAEDLVVLAAATAAEAEGHLSAIQDVHATLVRGEDGAPVWQLLALSADLTAEAVQTVRVAASSIGDVSADGTADVAIHVLFGLEAGADASASADLEALVGHYYIVSGDRGEVLHAVSDATDGQVPLQDLADAAYLLSSDDVDEQKGTPGLGLAFVLPALAALALRRRR